MGGGTTSRGGRSREERDPTTPELNDPEDFREDERLEQFQLRLDVYLQSFLERRSLRGWREFRTQVMADIARETEEDVRIEPLTMASMDLLDVEEAWRRKNYEKVVQLASKRIEDLSRAPLVKDREGAQQLCNNFHFRFKAYSALGQLTLTNADADRTYSLQYEFDVTFKSLKSTSPSPQPQQDTDASSVEHKSTRLDSKAGQKRPVTEAIDARETRQTTHRRAWWNRSSLNRNGNHHRQLYAARGSH